MIPIPYSTKGVMTNQLVIRFGSLGDLCVLGWSLARLADATAPNRPRVTLVTKAAWADLAWKIRGVDRVVSLQGSGAVAVRRVAKELRDDPFDRVVDAHNVMRSHLLLGLMARRPDARLAKDTVARLAFMRFGRRSPCLERTMRDRFDDLFPEVQAEPGAPVEPPLAHLSPHGVTRPAEAPLGLAPGAQWSTKRWPDNKFNDLAKKFLETSFGTVRIYLGPREETWFADSPLAALTALDPGGRVEIIRDSTLVGVATSLAGCGRLVTNDSGLLHLAEAVGTPVTALFGPTVREFGYFPQLAASRVLETDLDCRPCSRNGKRPCHRGDLACLDRIPVDDVLAALADGEETA